MADPFRTENLIYKAVDIPGDEDIFLTILKDGASFRQYAHEISIPQNRQTVSDLMKGMVEKAIVAVVPCLPGPEPSFPPIPIGWITLRNEDPEFRHHRRSVIGISLAEPYRNKGYGSEAIRWILNWGFKTAGLHRIGIKVFAFNEGACRLYERLGFVREGVARESIFHEGKWWDEIELSMLEHEWRAMEEKKKSSNA